MIYFIYFSYKKWIKLQCSSKLLTSLKVIYAIFCGQLVIIFSILFVSGAESKRLSF